MKILVISDTHKNMTMLRKAIDNHPDIEHVFHLGDLTDDIEGVKGEYPEKTFHCHSSRNADDPH